MTKWLDELVEILKVNMLLVTAIGIFFGLLGAAVGATSLFFPDEVADSTFFDAVDNVDIVLFVVGFLVLVTCAFYFYDSYVSQREFNELLQTRSRAKFVRNQNELERLALKLGRQKEKEYFLAKRRLRIK